MIAKDINQITEKDLQGLIDNSVLQSKTIEYKQTLPSNSDSGKKEFLGDVSSFANASGGDLIYGIIEDRKTGIPKVLRGLTIENVDQEISRLDSMTRDGIDPRIIGVTIKAVDLSNSRKALIIRIPKSWISPHRVTFKGYDKFYSRSANGKYPLDVGELRVAFTLSEVVIERIRRFREDRLSKILANEAPVPLYDDAKIILHLVPIISFTPGQSYNIDKIASHATKMNPINSGGGYPRYNLDGLLHHSESKNGRSRSYTQLFRNGIIEAIEGLLLRPRTGGLLIPAVAYEMELIRSLRQYLSVLKTLHVEMPLFVFLTLIGVKGYSIGRDDAVQSADEVDRIDRDVLLVPEVIMESYDKVAEDVLRPCFDTIWNACGYSRSLNYNDSGEWRPK